MRHVPPALPFPPTTGGRHVRFGAQGQNWIHITSQLVTQLGTWLAREDHTSTVSLTVCDNFTMCTEGPIWIARGDYDIGVTTPLWHLENAIEGVGRFDTPLPLKVLAVLPHDDYLTLAVRTDTGIRSLHDIRERKMPLNISMHTLTDYSTGALALDELFRLYGFSVDDIRAWGGEILPFDYAAYTAVTGEPVEERFHAVFDEAIMTRRWHRISEKYDLTFLPIEEDMLQKCEALGMSRASIPAGRLRGVTQDVPTISFDGWALYCRADLPEEIAYHTVRALHAQQKEINKRFDVEFAGMTSPFDISNCDKTDLPIHPGAARYYAELRDAA